MREAGQSPPSSAEGKTAWSYTSNPPYIFIAWYLRKRRYKYYLLEMKSFHVTLSITYLLNRIRSSCKYKCQVYNWNTCFPETATCSCVIDVISLLNRLKHFA